MWRHGFNVVDGCGFDKAGNFYAVELQANGFNPSPRRGHPDARSSSISITSSRAARSAALRSGGDSDPSGGEWLLPGRLEPSTLESARVMVVVRHRAGGLRDEMATVCAYAMSGENVSAVREIYRAFAEHRFPAERLAEEFVWETAPDIPGGGTYKGHAAVQAYFRDWVGGWYEVESNVEQLIDRGDQVVALIHGRYRLSPQADAFEAHYAHIWTLRDRIAVHARATSGRNPEELGFQL